MSDVEAAIPDSAFKPFDPEKAGKPFDASAVVDGLPDTPADDSPKETDKKEVEDTQPSDSDKEGYEKKKEEYAAKIQEQSEELYELNLKKTLEDDEHLATLIEGDSTDKKFAAKILKRNSEKFGASTIEEYQLKMAKDKAGDDPVKIELAEIKFRQDTAEKNQEKTDWDTWKEKNGVEGKAAEIADQIHADHPALDNGLVMAATKGMMGGEEVSSKSAASMVVGGEAAPKEEEINMSSPAARAMLRKVDMKKTKEFAKTYSV